METMKILVELGGEAKVSTAEVEKNIKISAEVKVSGEEAQANTMYEEICDYKSGLYSREQKDKATEVLLRMRDKKITPPQAIQAFTKL